MKFALSSRQTAEYLKKADEIKVQWRDRNSIIDLVRNYPSKTIILETPGDEEPVDWKAVQTYKTLAKNNFMVCVKSVNELRQAHSCGVRRYFAYPIQSFWELNAIKNFDVEYVFVDNELFFQLDRVKTVGIKVRVIPNVAYDDNLPHENGILGKWIRPEDLNSVYEEYVDAVEFADCDINKEQAMFRIYAEQKEWRQDLGIIITNLDYFAVNRLIYKEVGPSRINCRQRCLKGQMCRVCPQAFLLASEPEKFERYKKENNG